MQLIVQTGVKTIVEVSAKRAEQRSVLSSLWREIESWGIEKKKGTTMQCNVLQRDAVHLTGDCNAVYVVY